MSRPPRIVCHELPAFDAARLDHVRRAFAAASPVMSQQAWLPKPEKQFLPMTVRTGWRGAKLFVFAELDDADVSTRATRPNQRFWELGDVFEIFLRPEDRQAYVEFQVAPNNLRLQLRYPGASAFRQAGAEDAVERFILHSKAFASSVWLRPEAGKWFVLAEISARSVCQKDAVLPGERWKFSFSRYDYTRGNMRPVISSTSPHARPGFHRQAEWGTLVFAGREPDDFMKFNNATAQIFVPDGLPVPKALKRITHLGIGAHQDDLEFMAFHGVAECFADAKKKFGGVTCTNGAGSSRSGNYAKFSDEQMQAVRRQEQNAAAVIGRYGVMIQLDYPSSAVKSPRDPALKNDLEQILAAARPEVVYTHNLADKHDTHLGVVIAALQALRELPRKERPKKVIGCEVWRNLDWLADGKKVLMNVSGRDHLAAALNGVFDSQIAGGKRYDLATLGRRSANATFFESHATDQASQVIFGMDLTPLVQDEAADIVEFVCGHIDEFKNDVKAKLSKRLGRD